MSDPGDQTTHTEDRIKQSELRLKELEIRLKESELASKRSFTFSPLAATVVAAFLGVLGTLVASIVQGRNNTVLERQKAESGLIAKLLETGDAQKAAENISFLIDAGIITEYDRKRLLRAIKQHNPVLPSQGPETFEPTPSGFQLSTLIPAPIRGELTKSYSSFRSYLEGIGFSFPAHEPKITTNVPPDQKNNAYYMVNERTIYVDASLTDDSDVLRREYGHYALDALTGYRLSVFSRSANAIGSGTVDYYACSWKGDPIFGQTAAQTLRAPNRTAQPGSSAAPSLAEELATRGFC
jgi:hypothetical protein